MEFFVLILALTAAAGYIYARFIEPNRLVARRYTVESDLAPEKIKIAAFSDTHIGIGGMAGGRIEKIMVAIERENPDMVIFLGDLYYNYAGYGDKESDRLTRAFSMPGLPLAKKYAVCGNHDMSDRAKNAFTSLFENAGWQILANNSHTVKGINIIGSDDVIFGRPDVSGLIRQHAFNLLLVHEPDFADSVSGVQLQLSGHTHGGQIRLPLVGAAVLPRLGRKYVYGRHQKAAGGTVIVTGGLGMTTLPLRFMAVPEIIIITIEGKANDRKA